MTPFCSRFRLFFCAAVVLFCHRGLAEDGPRLSDFYGFSGVELYKLDSRAFGLCSGDFDNDGRGDLLAVDNRSSCLRFFRQRVAPAARQTVGGQPVNRLDSDWRFDIRQISVDKQIAAIVTGDLNSDGRTDIAYIGAPDRLVVRYQPEPGKAEWTERWSVRLPDLAPSAWMIACGDLNNDQRSDLAVLGKSSTYVLLQKDDGSFAAPEVSINTSAQLSLLQIADLDGDGLQDLTYQANEGANRGLCARLQAKDGRLGPEVRFDVRQPRSVTIYDVDQQAGHEVLTVDSRTGRVVMSQVARSQQEDAESSSRLVQYGIGEGTGREKRAVAVGDIDHDQRADVVITDPEKAQVLVYRQTGENGLSTAEAFPGYLDATDVAVTDVDGDGRVEVILLSEKEGAIGISRFSDGRLQFPETIATPDDGFTFAAMSVFRRGKQARIAVCQKKGSGSSTIVQLRQLVPEKDGWVTADSLELPTGSSGTRGLALKTLDADQDQVDELAVMPIGSGNRGILLLRQKDATFEVLEPLNLGTTAPGEVFEDHGQLYAAREAFVRQMKLTGDRWTVADQFNAGESKARLEGVAVLNVDNTGRDEVVLVDTGVRKLRLLSAQEGGLYRPWKEVDLGAIRYVSSHVADLNSDGTEDLLLMGNQQFSVLYSGTSGVSLQEVATWEGDREGTFPADIIAGDVNGDGAIDLAVIDTSINGLQLLNFDPEKGLRDATHFRVFEEKRLVSKANARGTEPREGLIRDVTGDGRADLILLCHDRLIVYPQDAGESERK